MENIQIIKTWLEQTVIGMNLCPFAEAPYEKGAIDFHICESVEYENIYNEFIKTLEKLSKDSSIETSLLITPNVKSDFREYYDFILTLEDLLEENNLSTIYQLVAFHPEFQFEGLDKDDKANYVNRSPLPLIHILKTESIEKLGITPEDAEKISLENSKKFD
jgi:hypothetical protein